MSGYVDENSLLECGIKSLFVGILSADTVFGFLEILSVVSCNITSAPL